MGRPRQFDHLLPEMIAYYELGNRLCDVAKRFGCAEQTAGIIFRRAGYAVRDDKHDRLVRDADDVFAFFCECGSPRETAVHYGCSTNTFKIAMRAAGKDMANIPRKSRGEGRHHANGTRHGNRRYEFNEAAFDTITEESAYWVGFLMADGFVCQRKRSPHSIECMVGLTLSTRDEDHIRKFLDFLGSDRPIGHASAKNHSGSTSDLCHTAILSKRLVEALSRYGVVPNKTYTAKVFLLEMDRHFWRGVIDGDGCIHTRKNGNPTLNLTGSRPLLTQFRDFVHAHAPGCKMNLAGDRRMDDRIASFYITKRFSVKILELLYGDCTVALERKRRQAEAILADPDNFRDRRKDLKWGHLTDDGLNADYFRLGSWKAVAASMGIKLCALHSIRQKRGMMGRPPSVSEPIGEKRQNWFAFE